MKTLNFRFVSVELHSGLFAPSLTSIYHQLEFVGIGSDQTQIVYIKNSPNSPESSIMRDSGNRKFCLEFMYEVCHKDSEESRA